MPGIKMRPIRHERFLMIVNPTFEDICHKARRPLGEVNEGNLKEWWSEEIFLWESFSVTSGGSGFVFFWSTARPRWEKPNFALREIGPLYWDFS